MGILDSIVEWIATQVMNLLDLITGSVLGALGCDMSTFLRYFPAAETLYEIFVAIGVGFILLNLVWQLFRNFGLGLGLSAEDPVKLAIKSILFIFLALFADQIMVLVLGIVGTPYDWVVDTALPPIEFASFASVVTVLVGSLVSGSVSLIVLILVLIVAWNYTAVLETVFRQASNSRIITNAYAINHNDTHLQFGDDFQFLEVQNSEEAAQLVIKNYLREVSLHGIEDVQILSPLRKRGAVAANALNETIRDLVNPPNNLKKEVKCGSRVFRVGDRIMQTANRINVSNGDVGVITDMKKEDDETITCVRLLDGRTLQYTQEMLEDLEFSYCTTIHKSQGQEYPVIIVPLLKEHYIMLRRNLLYTAVTRAKAKVILIGQKQAVFVAIHKCDVGQRNTVLADRIVAYYNRELSRRVA